MNILASILRPLMQRPFQSLMGLQPSLGSVRAATYGAEYQPSMIKRKRMFGFIKRLKTLNGRKILLRRMLKGRLRLSPAK